MRTPVTIVLLAISLCCAGVSRAASRIIFVSGGQLYSMLPDGSLLTSLTTGGARSPIVDRDRQTVAFISPTGIACYDAASATIHTIPMPRPPSALLCFTPDAQRIYFTRDITVNKSPTVAVFSIAIDGRDEQTCHGKPGGESWVSPFSPDGRWLVTAADTGLVRVSPDGKLRRAVPLGKKQQEFESLLDPTDSPDGAHIAFCWTTSGDYVHGELYLVRPDGSALTNLAPLREEKPALSSIFYPCFSPNGKQLAFIGWEMWGPDPETE
ncbi:MAG TPA: hypothetical protein VGL77_11440, partial [Armatimonadota bacterium]